jgi:hypothetical protein
VYRFRLPPGVDPTSIRADHADGTLAVHVPNPARFRRTVIPVTLAAAPASRGGDAARAVPAGETARSPRHSADGDADGETVRLLQTSLALRSARDPV